MKIKELKKILATLPDSMDDIEIFSTISVGCCGEVEDLVSLDVDFRLPDNKPSNHPNKDFGSLRFHYDDLLPGYRSCRQVSMTKEEDKNYWLQFPSSQYFKLYKKD